MSKKGSYELKVFIMKNVKVEEGWKTIVENPQGKTHIKEQVMQKEEEIRSITIQIEHNITEKIQETIKNTF